MLPGTEASRTTRGTRLQRAVRKGLRVALLRIPVLLVHPVGHTRLLRTLLDPRIVGLTQRHPQLAWKYLGGNYLARRMTTRTRLESLTHHYDIVRTRLRAGFLDDVLAGRVTLWQDTHAEHRFSVTLAFPRSPHHPDRMADHEGDLALNFAMDGVPLYTLCFSVVPDSAVHLGCGNAIFLGRLQGADGRFEQIRLATRQLHDISPKDILLAALQGIAQALGIDTLIGVSNAEQLSKSRGVRAESVLFDYDSFWQSLQAQRTIDNLFMLPLPIPDKPIETIAQKHRSRTLRKRRYKESVSEAACNAFRVQCLAHRQECDTAEAAPDYYLM